MNNLSHEQMQVVIADGVGSCVFSSVAFCITAAGLITFSGGFLAFAIAYSSYVLAIDGVISNCQF